MGRRGGYNLVFVINSKSDVFKKQDEKTGL
jgi:hypothetical protein